MTISVGNLIVAGGASVDTSEVLSALNKQGLKVWVGTKTQRDALPENVKNDDKITFLTYDSEEDIYLIVDTIISYSKTWSSVKISTELAKKINSSDVYTKTEVMSLINSKVASALKYRGAVATVAALPSTGQENGDSYYVQADGYMYAWSSDYSDWQALGSATDMTDYYTKSEVDALLADMAVKFQYNVMPTADSTTVGKIIQYTGADTNDYKNGYWYKGIDNGDSTYSWALHSVGDYYTKSELDANFSKARDMVASSSSIQSLQALLDDVHPELWAPDTYQGSLIINGWGVGTYQATITDNASANHKVVITGTFSTATDGARPFVATYTSSNVWNIVYTALVSYVDNKISDTVTRHNYSVVGTLDAIADTKALVSHITTLDVGTYAGEFKRTGVTFGSYRLTYFIDGIYAKSVSGIVTYSISVGTDATYQVSYVEDIEHGTPPVWKIEKLATAENLTNTTLGEYQLQAGGDNYAWFDLGTSTSTSNSQAFLFYEITCGRVDGAQSKILVSCSGTMVDSNYIKIVNLNNAQTSAYEKFKIDSNKHLWLGMQSYCYAYVKVYGRWAGMGSKTTVEPTGTILPIYKLVASDDLTAFVPYNQTDGNYLMVYASQHWNTVSNKALCKAYASNGSLIFAGILQWTGASASYIDNRVTTQQAGSGSITATNEMGSVAFSDTVTCVEMHRLGDHD